MSSVNHGGAASWLEPSAAIVTVLPPGPGPGSRQDAGGGVALAPGTTPADAGAARRGCLAGCGQAARALMVCFGLPLVDRDLLGGLARFWQVVWMVPGEDEFIGGRLQRRSRSAGSPHLMAHMRAHLIRPVLPGHPGAGRWQARIGRCGSGWARSALRGTAWVPQRRSWPAVESWPVLAGWLGWSGLRRLGVGLVRAGLATAGGDSEGMRGRRPAANCRAGRRPSGSQVAVRKPLPRGLPGRPVRRPSLTASSPGSRLCWRPALERSRPWPERPALPRRPIRGSPPWRTLMSACR